jgi:hypothetical protein
LGSVGEVTEEASTGVGGIDEGVAVGVGRDG